VIFNPGPVLPKDMGVREWGEFLRRFVHFLRTSTDTETAANIASIAADINIAGKYTGKLVWDTTNERMLRAAGSATNSEWQVVDGSVQVTPS
jgi:hypothetical protein